jgi:hypothetical protein
MHAIFGTPLAIRLATGLLNTIFELANTRRGISLNPFRMVQLKQTIDFLIRHAVVGHVSERPWHVLT